MAPAMVRRGYSYGNAPAETDDTPSSALLLK